MRKVKIITAKRKTTVSRAVIRKAVRSAIENENKANQKNESAKSNG